MCSWARRSVVAPLTSGRERQRPSDTSWRGTWTVRNTHKLITHWHTHIHTRSLHTQLVTICGTTQRSQKLTGDTALWVGACVGLRRRGVLSPRPCSVITGLHVLSRPVVVAWRGSGRSEMGWHGTSPGTKQMAWHITSLPLCCGRSSTHHH